ncbi:LytR/AlgR family response regulator transcription factor [Dokdonia ponticola]|uniref:LytR/AlgR family response regulator transcription factor n=1 Tax=Dokdonia ponticola TaxID=2041041 RepID=A0ABV9I3Z0_9FLAO
MSYLDAVIVEDDIKGASLLAHVLRTYCNNITLVGIAHDVNSAKEIIKTKQPKILLLDVKLHDKTCFDLLAQITYDNIKIVFITAHESYAIDAIRHNAIDYLLKPLDIPAIVSTISKIVETSMHEEYSLKKQLNSLEENSVLSMKSNYFAIASMDEIKMIKYNDIIYLASDGRYTTFYLVNKNEIVASKNIGQYEKMLIEHGFYRIHKSYIINLNFVLSIDKKDGGFCCLINSLMLPISFRRKNGLFRYLNIK